MARSRKRSSKGKAKRKGSSKRRRWILFSIVGLLLVGGAGGAYYVFKVAKTRTSPYKQALEARKAGDSKAAEAQLRSILKANAKDDRARSLLIQIVAEDKRTEEAEELARHWLDDPATEVLGFRSLGQLALRRMDVPQALRFARLAADRDPGFAQSLIMQVQDAMGTPASRERSVRAAETLATLTKVPVVQAKTWLYAAETLNDIASTLPKGPARSALTARRELDRTKALEALRASPHWQHRVPEATALMAGIELLSDDEDAQRRAVETSNEFLKKHPDVHGVRASLVRHLISKGEYAAAVQQIRALRDGPTLFLLRALSHLAEVGQRAHVLKLLDEMGDTRGALLDRMRARVLIAGEGTERTKGVESFESLAQANPKDDGLIAESYSRIKAAGESGRALRLLERAAQENPDLRRAAVLERAVASVEAGDAEATATALTELAPLSEGKDLLAAFNRLKQIEGAGEDASFALLDKAMAARPDQVAGIRLLRAAVQGARQGNDARGVPWSQRAKEDLRAILADGKAPREVLVSGATLAAVSGEKELTGIFMGRALVTEGEKGDPIRLFLNLCRLTDATQRESVAQGMVQGASPSGADRSWLEGLAAALAAGKSGGLRKPAGGEAAPLDGPQPIASQLQFRLAALERDWAEAEAYARKILATWPDLPGGVELLGAVLLDAGKKEDVLTLHAGTDLSPSRRAQRVLALSRLDRSEEAIAEARILLRETDGSDRALLILGELLRKVDPDAAIAALAPIAGQANVEMFRGELLEGRGDEGSAAQIYEELLVVSGNRNLDAWRSLARVRAAQGRQAAFILRVSPVIDAPPRGMSEAMVTELVMLRGMAREGLKDYQRALEDYRRVLAFNPRSVSALNNAAWLIATQIVWRRDERAGKLEEALSLVDSAVEQAAQVPEVHHTRAKILEIIEKREAALKGLEKAIELMGARLTQAEASKARPRDLASIRRRGARYQLDKAGVLEALGRGDEARAIYEAVRTDFADVDEGRRAARALERMGS